MKKLSRILVALLVAALFTGFAVAETVIIAITDGQGNVVMANEAIDVSDMDADGALTVYDALVAAHDAAYEGGAEAGFASADVGYGLSINKLWGEENGGSYGYYVNNASAFSLVDPVKEGDFVQAYVYTDLEAWSDTYCNFADTSVESTAGAAIELTLTAQTFDANWNPVSLPVADAVITINGEDTEFITDAEGKASVTIEEAGEYVISARSDAMVLVPPVCVVTVAEV